MLSSVDIFEVTMLPSGSGFKTTYGGILSIFVIVITLVPSAKELKFMLAHQKPYFGSLTKQYDSTNIAGKNISVENFSFSPFIEVYNATVL